MPCRSCGLETPRGRFCVRCGVPDPHGADEHARPAAFAAAPGEAVALPSVVSTLFPQLPRVDMRAFRAALAGGTIVVLALGAARVLPAAVLLAGLLVPLLTLLYLWDVAIYEEQPVRVLALTMGWGVVVGLGVALLARTVSPAGTEVLRSDATTVLVAGVLFPLGAAALVLSVPLLVLLPWRRFNDVLDGATFGASAAVCFAGAQTLTYGFDLLRGGLRPAADVWPWLSRLATLAVGLPVLTMASLGAVAGAFWLRHRAPVRDRGALGVAGRPAVAVGLAAALLVAAAATQPLLPLLPWMLWVFALMVAALVWLRRTIHVGLVQEAGEAAVGPAITCPNCHAQTPSHTFCAACGVALRALPKARA